MHSVSAKKIGNDRLKTTSSVTARNPVKSDSTREDGWEIRKKATDFGSVVG